MRTVASQMKDAEGFSVTTTIDAVPSAPVDVAGTRVEHCTFTASGRAITFPGFLKAYVEGHDDPDEAGDDSQARLPQLIAGAALDPLDVTAAGHETRPPARYTEAQTEPVRNLSVLPGQVKPERTGVFSLKTTTLSPPLDGLRKSPGTGTASWSRS